MLAISWELESLSAASNKARAYDMVGQGADQQVQEFVALRDVADSMKQDADRKTELQNKAALEAEAAAQEATDRYAAAETRLSQINTEKEKTLVAQLAAQKGTTAQIEREIQDQKEAEARKLAEEQQKALVEQAQQAATRPSQPQPAQPVVSSENASGTANAPAPAPEPVAPPGA